jgi:hypothetical protein
MALINNVTPWNTEIIEKLIVPQLIKKFLGIFFWKPNHQYSFYNSPPPDPRLSQINLNHVIQ